MSRRSRYLEVILGHDALSNNGKCVKCSGRDGFWRCLDCFGHEVLCRDCCREYHYRLPFHRIEFWTGSHYRGDWLCNLGVVIDLGHGGRPCPLKSNSRKKLQISPLISPASSSSIRDVVDIYLSPSGTQDDPDDATKLTIGHQNGIHRIWVRFCICGNGSDEYQLLDSALYPVTFTQIRTAFTFETLDDFRLENLECKTSAYHYFKKLRRLTSPLFPSAVPVCAEYILILCWLIQGRTAIVSSSGLADSGAI